MSLHLVIQDIKEKLMDKGITSYQGIPTCSMWVDTLTKEIDIHEELQEVLIEGNLKLKNKGINKVQCIDGKN